MTVASSMQHRTAQPTGVNWLALHLGLVLVAWGRRSANRPELSWEEQHTQHEANRMRAALLEERALVPTPR